MRDHATAAAQQNFSDLLKKSLSSLFLNVKRPWKLKKWKTSANFAY